MQIVKLREYNKDTNQETINNYVVASTKTKNILVDNKTQQGLYVAVLDTQEFYVDRDKAIEVATMLADSVGIDIRNNVINALEVACIVKRLDK